MAPVFGTPHGNGVQVAHEGEGATASAGQNRHQRRPVASVVDDGGFKGLFRQKAKDVLHQVLFVSLGLVRPDPDEILEDPRCRLAVRCRGCGPRCAHCNHLLVLCVFRFLPGSYMQPPQVAPALTMVANMALAATAEVMP